ncbi:hypothetical protein GCM10009630_09060 [Kribbella jejuensis]
MESALPPSREREPMSEKTPEQLDRLRRRAAFLREREEARALRDRIAPRRARARQLREAMRWATYHH